MEMTELFGDTAVMAHVVTVRRTGENVEDFLSQKIKYRCKTSKLVSAVHNAFKNRFNSLQCNSL